MSYLLLIELDMHFRLLIPVIDMMQAVLVQRYQYTQSLLEIPVRQPLQDLHRYQLTPLVVQWYNHLRVDEIV